MKSIKLFADDLPAGWQESRPGALATNPDPVLGGIVDRTIVEQPDSKNWFVIPHYHRIKTLKGVLFTSRAEAFNALFAAIAAQSKTDDKELS